MTVQQMIESVQQIFPDVLEKQIIIEIDSAQKKFCRKSRILRKLAFLGSITSQAQWTLPDDFIYLYRVIFYNSSNQAVDKTDVQLDWVVEAGVLIIYSTSSSVISSIPTTVDSVQVRYSYLSGDVIDRTSIFDIEEDYTEGIFAYVMESMYSKFPVVIGQSREGNPIIGIHLQMVLYWKSKAKETEILAKKVLNMTDSTEKNAVYYPHAGRLVLPEEHKIGTLTIIA